MNIVIQNPTDVQMVVAERFSLSTDIAFDFGFDDAGSGVDQCGSAYFLINSPEWDAYNEGYLANLEANAPLVNPERLATATDLVQRATTSATAPVLWAVVTAGQLAVVN